MPELDAGNEIASMDKMLHVIEESKRTSKDIYEQFLEHIEAEYAAGHLEPENYDALQQLLKEAQSDYEQAFDEDTSKMLSYLQALRQKIDEYLKIT